MLRNLAPLPLVALPALASAFHAQCEAVYLGDVLPASVPSQSGFGHAFDVEGGLLVVGSAGDDGLGPASGAAFVFEFQSGAWVQTDKLIAWDGGAGHNFGAAIDLDGNRLVVSASFADGVTASTGAVYIWDRTPTGWAPGQKLVAPDGHGQAGFGVAVAVEGDTLLVGAPVDDGLATQAGAVYAFESTGGSWVFDQKIHPLDGQAGAWFGNALALDGERFAAGALRHGPPYPHGGAAYVFTRASGSWVQEQKIQPGVLLQEDFFGGSLDLSGDVLVVGAGDKGLQNFGSVHVFERLIGAWTETATIFSTTFESHARFGTDLDLDGDDLLVGVPSGSGASPDSGEAVLLRRSTGGWGEVTRFHVDQGADFDNFGLAVALRGAVAYVAAPSDDTVGMDVGALHGFDLSEAGCLIGSPSRFGPTLGGKQILELDAGPAHGGETYLIVGSLSGTSPGIDLGGGLVLPLVYDAYTVLTTGNPTGSWATAFLGGLDAQGQASAQFQLPPEPSLEGLTVHHAFVSVTIGGIRFVSNPAPLLLLSS